MLNMIILGLYWEMTERLPVVLSAHDLTVYNTLPDP